MQLELHQLDRRWEHLRVRHLARQRRLLALTRSYRHLLRIKMDSALNLGYDEWPNFLGNRPMVEALLSRLRHYCHTVLIKGPSLRELQG
jgi:hypothetical protein